MSGALSLAAALALVSAFALSAVQRLDGSGVADHQFVLGALEILG